MGKWFVANQKTPTKIRFLISQWDLKRWGEIPTFVIQNKNNNIMNTKHYFCDCDYFHEDEQLWFGDLGYEADICDTENEDLENAIQNVLYWFESGGFEDNYDIDETFVMYSIFEGIYDEELDMWICPNAHDRQSKIVYRIFSGSKEFADRYGIKADKYMGFGA